jgi:hypothetical protein
MFQLLIRKSSAKGFQKERRVQLEAPSLASLPFVKKIQIIAFFVKRAPFTQWLS